jgi:hypothetical protein
LRAYRGTIPIKQATTNRGNDMDAMSELRSLNIPVIGKKCIHKREVFEIIGIEEKTAFIAKGEEVLEMPIEIDNRGLKYLPNVEMVWNRKLILCTFVNCSEEEGIKEALKRAR